MAKTKPSKPQADPWEWILRHERAIRAMCRRVARGREDVADDLWDVTIDWAIAYLPGLIARWCPSREVPLSVYAFGSLRWHMHKALNRNANRLTKHEQLNGHAGLVVSQENHVLAADDRDEVFTLLEGVPADAVAVLMMRHQQGRSFREIAVEIGCCRETARKRYMEAMAQARTAAGCDGATANENRLRSSRTTCQDRLHDGRDCNGDGHFGRHDRPEMQKAA